MKRIDFVGRGLLLSAVLLQAACGGPRLKAVAPPPASQNESTPHATAQAVPNGRLMIYTLPVGAGNCQVIHCPDQDKLVMMDCGSKGKGNIGWTSDDASKFIRSMIDSGTEIDVSVSHPDGDHYNYIPAVFGGVRVNALYLGKQLGDYDQNFRNWVAYEQGMGMPVNTHGGFYSSTTPNANLSCWRPDGHGGAELDVGSYILAMNAGTTSNDASMVIAMRYGSFQTLFTGDMTGATEQAILRSIPSAALKSNVVTGAHHGAESNGSNSASWAMYTAPQLLMFSAGERFLHPRCNSVDNYLPYVAKNVSLHVYHCGKDGAYEQRHSTDAVAVTDDNGLITVTANKNGLFDANWQYSALTAIDAPVQSR